MAVGNSISRKLVLCNTQSLFTVNLHKYESYPQNEYCDAEKIGESTGVKLINTYKYDVIIIQVTN